MRWSRFWTGFAIVLVGLGTLFALLVAVAPYLALFSLLHNPAAGQHPVPTTR